MVKTFTLEWPKGLKATGVRRTWYKRFATLTPGGSLKDIAARWGEPYTAVQRWANVFGYRFKDGRGHPKISGIDWDAVDWSATDRDIGRQLGVSHETVRQRRYALGIPKGDRRSEAARAFERFLAENAEACRSMTSRQVIERSGAAIGRHLAQRLLRAAGVRTLRHAPSKMDGADWRLPSMDLAAIWRVTRIDVTKARYRLGKGPSLWDGRDPRRFDDPEYPKALAAERRKAEQSTKPPAGRGGAP